MELRLRRDFRMVRRLEGRRLVAFLRGGDEEVARTMLAVFDQVERG